MPVKGIGRVKLNLDKKIQDITERSTADALTLVGTQGLAHANTMVPRDIGALLASAYQPVISKTSTGMVATVGYTMHYAKYVHDAPGTLKNVPTPRPNNRGNYWDPSGEPKFLEKGFEEIKPKIPALLKQAYKK